MTLLNIYSELYWITRLDNVRDGGVALLVVGILLALAYKIAYAALSDINGWDDDDKAKYVKRNRWFWRLSFPVMIIGFLVSVFIPTKNEYIFIVAGGKTINWIKQDSSLNKIPGQTTELIQQFLSNQIKELKK